MTPARSRGQKVNLSDLAGEPDLDDGRGPYALAVDGGRPIRIAQLALNPFNKRVLGARPDTIAELADSMRVNGQLQPCAVVTRAAFRRIFPDDDAQLGPAAFVQVTGARRYLAAQQLHWESIEAVIKDDLASSTVRFLSATAAENLDRRDFDPVEEAEQVQLVVAAAGSGQAAAEHLQRSPGWISQRLNLLKLAPELHAALRAGDIPLRDVRTLHTLDHAGQLAALHRFTAVKQRSTGGSDDEATPTPRPPSDRPTPAARAIRRLGGTPDKIAAALKAELAPDQVEQLVQHLAAGHQARVTSENGDEAHRQADLPR
ncbi:ParB/RepB/Spo0J family partition protein [Pseudonocardia sichuanensis]